LTTIPGESNMNLLKAKGAVVTGAASGIGKRPVAGEEIGAAALFLASDHARSINGDTIAIDGGSLTRGYPALLTGLKKAS
jgi:enoyl-[acyl-carrier-protein] reductase (NADH)